MAYQRRCSPRRNRLPEISAAVRSPTTAATHVSANRRAEPRRPPGPRRLVGAVRGGHRPASSSRSRSRPPIRQNERPGSAVTRRSVPAEHRWDTGTMRRGPPEPDEAARARPVRPSRRMPTDPQVRRNPRPANRARFPRTGVFPPPRRCAAPRASGGTPRTRTG